MAQGLSHSQFSLIELDYACIDTAQGKSRANALTNAAEANHHVILTWRRDATLEEKLVSTVNNPPAYKRIFDGLILYACDVDYGALQSY